MNYQTFVPDGQLSPFVKCYWTLEYPKEVNPQRQTIVPDGCMEMIFHYGDLFKQYLEDGGSVVQPRCFVIGQLSQPLEIEPMGKTGIFSVRFHPDGFAPFTTMSVKEMQDSAIALEKLFGNEGTELGRIILGAGTSAEKIRLIEDFLTTRLTDPENIDHIIKSTVETILTANGQFSIADLSRKININGRQLERKFSSAIGLSPKQLSKTIRLQVMLKLLLNKQFASLSALAYEGGYYDQAHFTRNLRD